MLGTVNSRGPSLVFMDAHMEVAKGWLEPLLSWKHNTFGRDRKLSFNPLGRLKVNKNITAISVVELLHPNTLEFVARNDENNISITGFNWNLLFKWISIPEREKKRRKLQTDPIRSPTMLGAFFGNLMTLWISSSMKNLTPLLLKVNFSMSSELDKFFLNFLFFFIQTFLDLFCLLTKSKNLFVCEYLMFQFLNCFQWSTKVILNF